MSSSFEECQVINKSKLEEPKFDKCAGAAGIRTPTIIIKKCPECGKEVEIFSNEMQTKCNKCGFTIYNDLESCMQWCKYARECVGEELYNKLKRKE